MSRWRGVAGWVLMLVALGGAPAGAKEGDGASGSGAGTGRFHDAPEVHEPLLFDLVRPLAARRGELEVNTLTEIRLRHDGRPVAWAPELEYAFLDGYAVELELPMLDRELAAVKVALQGTFGVLVPERLVHGFQLIAEWRLDDRLCELSALHLTAVRFDARWSAMVMAGVRTDHRGDDVELLLNPTLFFDVTEWLVLGIEHNVTWEVGRSWPEALILPQVSLHFASIALQVGVGLVTGEHGEEAVAATRITIIM
ncbi:MAG: hypothetical protein M9894_21490 [Planctomycetes bacterium]|nr:hypothetical protein [Planctomycetota bacterium]